MTLRSSVFVVLACLALALPTGVLAHAELVESDPADGATITTPYTLTATFAEEIDAEASTLFIENAAGERVATGTVDPDDHTRISANLLGLPNGVYVVRWTSVTPDDNGVERGTFSFSVSGVTTTPPPTSTSGDTIPRNDLVTSLVIAAIAIAAVVVFIWRGRR